ncbi:hypothetical protein D9611_000234 [Ephemerocybe angulata]|uniref:Uncharacterized protein n=2 Tax=Ephemerocybe angulata TaxID=980116 RepID=A0A8H5F7D6_9AGAR|nr:hypothetical protein D9611_000234 [Tulosesus angulatus]KAF6762973.1 hypothetical protein DFP72DRAFT_519016 [Tulosesus angulatus]
MATYYNPNFSASSSTLKLERAPRRLPSVPGTPPPSSIESRRSSRPLPKIPRALTCKLCQAIITSNNVLFPSSQLPPQSRTSFRGFSGKASLFTETYNVHIAKPGIQLMATGAHTMSEINCGSCHTYLGWKIVRAYEESERWKEGKFLLELESLYAQPDPVAPLNFRHQQSRSSMMDSDSGSDY